MTKRKIYYVPGMISLVLLLPLLYKWCQKEQASRELRALEVTVTNPKELLTKPIYGLTTFPPARDYLTLELTGNTVTDKIKLDYAQIRIHELETSADQIHGINIHFADSAKYRSVVKALDILLNKSNTIRCLWWKKDIWCLAPPTQPADVPAPILPFCGTSYMNRILVEESVKGLTEGAIDLFKSYWPVLMIFSGLVLCAAYFILQLRPAPFKLMRVFSEARRR